MKADVHHWICFPVLVDVIVSFPLNKATQELVLIAKDKILTAH